MHGIFRQKEENNGKVSAKNSLHRIPFNDEYDKSDRKFQVLVKCFHITQAQISHYVFNIAYPFLGILVTTVTDVLTNCFCKVAFDILNHYV